MSVIRIGYWAGDGGPWPDVRGLVDRGWDEDERIDTGLYLRYGLVARAYLGLSPCRFCGKHNGSLELTDMTYLWPEGLAHYVEEHGVRLPGEFVAHVRARALVMDDLEVDDSWWLGVRGPL
jgi:hypothetical protein